MNVGDACPARWASGASRWAALALVLLAWNLVFGCGGGKAGNGYHTFYTPADHVQELLDQSKIQEASQVYDQNPGFFTSADPAVGVVRDRLARALLMEAEPRLKAALQGLDSVDWPCARSGWPEVKKALGRAELAVQAVQSHRILAQPEYRPEAAALIHTRLNDLKMKITADAPEMLAAYPLLASDESFFEAYPTPVSPAKAFGNATAFWRDRLASASAEQVKRVVELYGGSLDEPALAAIGAAYYTRIMKEQRADGAPSLPAVVHAIKATQEAGLPLESTPGAKVVFVDVTSYTLLRKGLLDFPVAVENDMPFPTKKEDMRRLFASNATADADIYVLVDIAMTRSERDIYDKKDFVSEFLAGTRTVENRDYIDTRDKVMRLRQQYDQSVGYGVYAADPFVGMIGSISAIGMSDDLEEAEEKLKNTPKYVEEEIYKDYGYRVFDMDVVKLATVNYYVVDRRSMHYFKDTFDARQKQAFSIPYGLQHRDPHKHEIMTNKDAEEDVLRFEEDPITVPLSAILDQFVSQPEKSRKLASLSSLADQIFEERNRAVAAAKKAKVFTADVSHDDRFESVAYIELPQSLGSGFYVRDDIVMTNYHVVEESDFVEIRLYDGSETFGRVIAKDIHRDLALVKVQARRKPLAFYHANTVPVGATVEVIGNPHGFKFSLSRGVISAVREHHSIMGPKSKNVLFIQIDAAISPGNSGGPVFLGDSVVSVVDWGDSEDRAQNLNFTIHYSEVLEFMRKNDIEPILASEEDIHAKN